MPDTFYKILFVLCLTILLLVNLVCAYMLIEVTITTIKNISNNMCVVEGTTSNCKEEK